MEGTQPNAFSLQKEILTNLCGRITNLKAMSLPGLTIYSAVIFFILFFQQKMKAEGTKELAPNSTDVTMIYANETTFGSFAAYNGPESGRMYIHIADPENEQVFIGLSRQTSITNGSDGVFINTAYYFRIKDPSGNVVYGPQIINSTTANTDTWTLASNGPAPIVGASGYTPFTFDPSGLASGDYYIEFSENQNSASTGSISIKFWDVTVATTGGSPAAVNGRLWSNKWSFRTPSIQQNNNAPYGYFDRPFNGQVYLYTFDGFVSKIDFNNSGFRGLSFNLAYNEDGVSTSGTFEENRRSIENTNNTLAQYKIFLNDPDINEYPSGNIGSVDTDPLVVDCDPGNLCISYSTTEIGVVFILLDFDNTSGAGIYDQNTADVLLYERIETLPGETAPYERCLAWDGNDGLGNTVNTSSSIPVYMTYAQGMVHFPVYDVEFNINGYSVDPVRPLIVGFTQEIFYDDTDIPDAPGNGAAKDMVNGCTPPCHAYTNLDYGNLNTINTWWYTNQDFVINVQSADCVTNAFDDSETTVEETPVTVDVLANDQGDNLDTSSVTNTGLLPPSSGSISIDPSTGEITYTPVAGFTGTDIFQYSICNVGASSCDTAYVNIIVNCEAVIGNVITGVVFADENNNGVPNTNETGDTGITVILYEDENRDGQVDVGDTQIGTEDTDADGAYSFTVNNAFPVTYEYEDVSGAGVAFDEASNPCTPANPLTRTITVNDNYTIADINVGINLNHTWRSDLEVTVTSPAGTSVTVIDNAGSSFSNFDLLLDDDSSGSINDNNDDNVAIPRYGDDRTASPSNALSAFNGENVNGQWTVSICDGAGGDAGVYFRSLLQITSSTKSYVLEIDTNDLPCGAILSTDNVETASFSAIDQIDCANNFGYVPTSTEALAGSNSPVCEGDDIDLTESGGFAVNWLWSGPNGFSSILQNPSNVNASVVDAGNYTVTITDSDGCTATSSISVIVNQLVNAGTAVANDSVCISGSGLSLIDLTDKLIGEDSGGAWTSISGTPGANFNPVAGTLNPNGLPIDTYIFRYTVTSSSPCPDDTEDYSLVVYRCCPSEICLPLTATKNN